MRDEDIRLAGARRDLSEFDAHRDEPVGIRQLKQGLSKISEISDSPIFEDTPRVAENLFLTYARIVKERAKKLLRELPSLPDNSILHWCDVMSQFEEGCFDPGPDFSELKCKLQSERHDRLLKGLSREQVLELLAKWTR